MYFDRLMFAAKKVVWPVDKIEICKFASQILHLAIDAKLLFSRTILKHNASQEEIQKTKNLLSYFTMFISHYFNCS